MSLANDLISALSGDNDITVRAFRDMNGQISLCTMDDVLLDPDQDPRVEAIMKLIPSIDDDVFLDAVEDFTGSLNGLLRAVVVGSL